MRCGAAKRSIATMVSHRGVAQFYFKDELAVRTLSAKMNVLPQFFY